MSATVVGVRETMRVHDRVSAAKARPTPAPTVPARKSITVTVTAIPVEHGAVALLLICDDCGRGLDGGAVREEWIVLWHRAVVEGWTGRDRAIGPHRCRSCT